VNVILTIKGINMETTTLKNSFLPELGKPRRGKVREVYTNDNGVALIASDRISVFDRILSDPIPDKGRILTQLSLFWFNQTQDIITNHIISHPDPNVLFVKKCTPIMIEVIVRGYLVGSLWRDYKDGKRVKCGIKLPDGLQQNAALPEPIVTPTTKSEHGHDEDITEEEIIQRGLATPHNWKIMKEKALQLYNRGQEVLKKRELILVDTKYEFGLDANGNIVLIDEIHTPDSSRFWYQNDLACKEVKFPDKEFLREWLRERGFTGDGPVPTIPLEVQQKVRNSYRELYEIITGMTLPHENWNTSKRLIANLKKEKMIRGVFALVIAGSESDSPHVEKILAVLKQHNVPYSAIYASAHKQPKVVVDLIDEYNQSLEPVVWITVAGRSNALSGVVASNTKWPVIACPPFKDYSDYLVNIHSSLQMPSNVPAMTVVDPGNAALAAVRILNTMEHNS
jgi:phosphoribosylaminoimidazole-succinocarboxamide synthase